jgi:hypothetical protein
MDRLQCECGGAAGVLQITAENHRNRENRGIDGAVNAQ